MDNDELIDIEESQFVTPPLYLRVWWRFWGSPATYHHGWRYWREGLYMWIAARLPAEIVSRAAMRMVGFADDQGIPSYDIVNVASYWDSHHAPAAAPTEGG